MNEDRRIDNYFDGRLSDDSKVLYFDSSVSFWIKKLGDLNIIRDWAENSNDVSFSLLRYDDDWDYVIVAYEYTDKEQESLARIKRMERMIQNTKIKDGNIGPETFSVSAKNLLGSLNDTLARMKQKHFEEYGVYPDDIN